MFEMRGREGTFENEGLFQKWIAGEIITPGRNTGIGRFKERRSG
jgi:hypothetical protein